MAYQIGRYVMPTRSDSLRNPLNMQLSTLQSAEPHRHVMTAHRFS